MQTYIKLYRESLISENSQKTLARSLSAAMSRLPEHVNKASCPLDFHWHQLTLEELSALKSSLINEGRAASYINTLMTMIRQVLHWAFLEGELAEIDFERSKQVLKSVKSNKKRQASQSEDNDEIDLDWLSGQLDNLSNLSGTSDLGALPQKTVEQLLLSIGQSSSLRVRNRAIFMCMSHAGLRREEVSTLRLQDIHFARNKKDSFIKVIGKGARLREVPINKELHLALLGWLTLVMKSENKKKATCVFRKINNIGKILNAGLSTRTVYGVIRSIGEDDGIPGLHPHKLRHYFATSLLVKGRDIFEVARLLGHSNVETTRRYDDRGFETLQEAVGCL